MDPWIDQLAQALGEESLTTPQTSTLLGTARDVAHRVERRITPLTTFLLGEAVGRAVSAGASRTEALEGALATMRSILPDAPAGDEA